MKLEKLKNFAIEQGFVIKYIDFKTTEGRLYRNRIGIHNNMEEEKQIYILAHEIAHAYLHEGKGDTIDNEKHAEYEEQADRGARMILDLLSMDMDSCNVGGAD